MSIKIFWVRGYKTFFMPNSAEHEILNARKIKNIKKIKHFFSGSDKPRTIFFLLIKVGWHSNIYQQEKF